MWNPPTALFVYMFMPISFCVVCGSSFIFCDVCECSPCHCRILPLMSHQQEREYSYTSFLSHRFIYKMNIMYFKSSLNGSHGEYTNTDDHDNAERKRRHKESVNHTFQNGFGKTKVQNGPPNPVCKFYALGKCTRQQCRFAHIDDPSKPDPNLQTVLCPEPKIEPGRDVYRLSGISFLLGTGPPRPTFLKDNDTCCDLDNERQVIKIPTFKSFGKVFFQSEVVVYPTLYKYILGKLKVLANEERNARPVEEMKIAFSFLSRGHIDGSLIYYQYRNLERLPSTSVIVPSAVPINLGFSVNVVAPVVIPCTLSPCKFDYYFNRMWMIVDYNGFNFNVSRHHLVQCINFDTEGDIVETARNYVAFFQFTPRIPFQVYAPCAKNVCGALSRYFKGPYQNEPDYFRRRNQFSIINGIPLQTLKSVAAICNAEVRVGIEGSYRVRSRFGNSYPVQINKSTFMRAIDSYVSKYWVGLLFIKFLMYIVDTFGLTWNSLVYLIYVPFFYLLDYATLVREFIRLPHPKRLVYSCYVLNISTFFKVIDNIGTFESKFKWEYGKVGKEGRLYATGDHLAISDFFVSTFLKYVFKKEIIIGEIQCSDGIVSVCAQYMDTQERFSSDAMFLEATNLPNNTVKLIFFSDDGFLVSNIEGVYSIFETDFSACDASNGFPVFAAYYYMAEMCGFSVGASRVISQCSRNTTVRNPDNKKEYVVLQPETFFELSGNVGTTVYNNIAEIGFISSVYDELKKVVESRGYQEPCCVKDIRESLTLQLFSTSAENAGWKVVAIQRSSLNASTFLKRAFNGKYSWLVYGAILRSFGRVDGKPRGEQFGLSPKTFKSKSDKELTEILIRQTVLSLSNEPSSPLLTAMRIRAGIITEPVPDQITFDDLNQRYGTETYEWYQLLDSVHDLKIGDKISGAVLEKVFSVDYGTEQVSGDHWFDVVGEGHNPLNDIV